MNLMIYDASESSTDGSNRKERKRDKIYQFDRVFDHDSTQTEIFKTCVEFQVQSVLDGNNATVFAYGATSAGKTHTMMGTAKDPGIMFLTLQNLFRRLDGFPKDEYSVSISYLEIYNEKIRDLLTGKNENLEILEDPLRGVTVAGITYMSAKTTKGIMSLLAKGNRNRIQESTGANLTSSRSHAILQVYVSHHVKGRTKISKLSMIDLAGSERAAETMNKGMRMIEGANINRSLLALSNCINSLVEPKTDYVNYRDSKLTRLLKDSLVGNCQTVMIANISPAAANVEETLNTLKYASRARSIKNSTLPMDQEKIQSTVEITKDDSAATLNFDSKSKEIENKQYTDLELNLEKLFCLQLEKRTAQLDHEEMLALNRKEMKMLDFKLYQMENQHRLFGELESIDDSELKEARKKLEELSMRDTTLQDTAKAFEVQMNDLANQINDIKTKIEVADPFHKKYFNSVIKCHQLELKNLECSIKNAILTLQLNQRESQVQYSNEVLNEYRSLTILLRKELSTKEIKVPETIIKIEKRLFKLLQKYTELSKDLSLGDLKTAQMLAKPRTIDRIRSVLNFHKYLNKSKDFSKLKGESSISLVEKTTAMKAESTQTVDSETSLKLPIISSIKSPDKSKSAELSKLSRPAVVKKLCNK